MAITQLPTPPTRSDPENFAERADAFVTALPDFVDELNALGIDANSAAASAAAAAESALLAATSSGAAAWVSGATYGLGAMVYSTVDYRIYRRIVAGAGTTDPSSDAVNWVLALTGTGTGAMVLAVSPAMTTPNIGAATATSVNGTTIPTSKTLVVTTDKLSALASTTSAELAGVISDETGSGSLVFATSPSLTTPSLGVATATSINGTTIPNSVTLATASSKLSAFAATTSAELAGVLSDETGSGKVMYNDAPAVKGTWTVESGTWTIPAVTLGGTVSGGNNAISAAKTLTFNSQTTVGTTSGAISVDFSTAQKQKLTLTGTATSLSFSYPGVGHYQLVLVSGAYTVTNWPAIGSSWQWLNATTAPTLNSGTYGGIVNIYYDGTIAIASYNKIGAV